MNLSSRLNCRVEIHGKIKDTNKLGQVAYKYGKIKSIWAEIIPLSGNVKSREGNFAYADVSHKITIRANAVKELKNEMFFIFKGQRYDIKYSLPNYKYRDQIEIMCSLVVE